MKTLTVCVYCGSRFGNRPEYEAAALELGGLIGRNGWQLVYGGGNVGLMGVVADAAIESGARVVGIIPESLMKREVGHRGLAELHVVQTMHERKQMMAERADVFVALPGGIGTFEELFEVWTWHQLGYHDKPIGLLNVAGYYDTFLDFMSQTTEAGFLSETQLKTLQVDTDAVRLLQRLSLLAPRTSGPDDYTRI
ncbi:TIGR00730 family Rossman fold protein [Methylibium rhizosphaerae]|uniref:LOG family protein n=1 Tax=Methylibium rhizosphaerae TaxID=2570323 RepID=UPI001126F170|nr:TIGR00730 family Rossman fold protein [Methylibium rhizosphaerae]